MSENAIKEKKDVRIRIQEFGRFLSGMVMPNIGAFIAWGLITAFFIPTGWMPNENLGKMVGPMITYLLPLLIGYTGGKMVGGIRGGVVGAISTMGVIVGADIPMFLGAMVVGPLGGLVIKKFDDSIDGKVKPGFEMLVNNFSAGIIGMILAIIAYLGIGPVVLSLNHVLKTAVESIVKARLLPLISVFVEPAKILFLNNAINHGVLAPIGVQEAKEVGKSIFFLVESNPGPGLGILLAYLVFGKGSVKQSAPGAIIIHFLGGIHEIYFPYVLMNPVLLLAVMAGGASGMFTFMIFNVGLVATPSPGSIFALLAMTPKGCFLGVLAGVAVATIVSFLVASIFVKASAKRQDNDDFEKAASKVKELKNKKEEKEDVTVSGIIKKIVVACDAGMGSSAMGASKLRKKVQDVGLNIKVINYAINDIPDDADIIITHKNLTDRAKAKAPNKKHISIDNFIATPVYDELVEELKKSQNTNNNISESANKKDNSEVKNILEKKNIKLGLESVSKAEAIEAAGKLLVKSGYVKENYVEAMHERETVLNTYIGNGVAIPHGVSKAKEEVLKSGIVVLQYPDGIDYGDGNIAYMVIGIAGKGNDHLTILANIASALEDEALVKELASSKDVEKIYNILLP
ncbi:PTS mannitol transporter subunit IICBA [Clostridium niameyense]|uniref:PTS mannitol transporter subunit IICBA n=1 Tax=Clostridium niameyense TaxID=1622073 RepID=UPI00067F6AAB|nr:PTS mannitol transporter subunit IICBA [Clostridium niameyense]